MFGFDLHIFIWPDDFYRESSTPEAYLCLQKGYLVRQLKYWSGQLN
jgi:hypothetical protein